MVQTGDAVQLRRNRFSVAIGLCRLVSVVAALLLWGAWSVTVFQLLLGLSLLAGFAAMGLARVCPDLDVACCPARATNPAPGLHET